MDIIFRCDASLEIGTGHLIRCLTLAKAFVQNGDRCLFLSRSPSQNAMHQMRATGFDCISFHGDEEDGLRTFLNQKKDFLSSTESLIFFDSYQISAKEETLWRTFVKKIAVIDDLMNRPHECDYLIDCNYRKEASENYRHLVPARTELLLGPSFAPIRAEFPEARKHIPNWAERKGIFVFWGGTDPLHQSFLYIQELLRKPKPYLRTPWIFLISAHNPDKNEITLLLKNSPHQNLQLLIDPPAPWSEMTETKMYLGSGGTITWERMCLGLTGLVSAVADNQIENGENLATDQLHYYLGDAKNLLPSDVIERTLNLYESPTLFEQSEKVLQIVDGLGSHRIIQVTKSLTY